MKKALVTVLCLAGFLGVYTLSASSGSAAPITVSTGLIQGYVNMDGALPLGTKLWLDAFPAGDPTTSADWVALTGPGYYTLDNLASGEYKIRSSFVTYNSYVPDYANAYYDLQTTFSAGTAISVTQGLATETNLNLTQLGRICGSVSERFTGQPVPELFEVLARNTAGEALAAAHTDPNGSYCFWRLAPGTYYIVFSGLVWPETCPTACSPDQLYQEEGYFQAITLGRGAVVSGVNGRMAPYKSYLPVIIQ